MKAWQQFLTNLANHRLHVLLLYQTREPPIYFHERRANVEVFKIKGKIYGMIRYGVIEGVICL